MADYKHGLYGEFVASVGETATQSGTVAVYVGVAPVNLIRGYAKSVNTPIKMASLDDVHRIGGYSDNWAGFDLCEAFKQHFDNAAGNVGPIVAINVLDPAVHKKAQETTVSLSFYNGRATIQSDTIILDTLVLAGKVEGVDFSLDYDFARGQVVINSLGDIPITGSVSATYSEVDTSAIDEDSIIGGVTSGGVYTGLGCVGLVYQELNLVPNLILCPGWSHKPAVYAAMVKAATKINGRWNAGVYADIPVLDGATKVDTIDAAITWAETHGYKDERTKVWWPKGKDSQGRACSTAVNAAWRKMLVDAANGGVPMESPSNKAVPIVGQYFGEGSLNRGFDQQQGNRLNAAGISTIVFWGGQWVLWGPHTAAYKHGNVTDPRVIFDTTISMMMHVLNSFQQEWALTIDQPMTRALADTIKNREQEKADALAAMGAFIGEPVVDFKESSNPTSELVEGNFVWGFKGTTTPPFKSGDLKVGYTTAGFDTYFGEV